jgi:hypothetical protein
MARSEPSRVLNDRPSAVCRAFQFGASRGRVSEYWLRMIASGRGGVLRG